MRRIKPSTGFRAFRDRSREPDRGGGMAHLLAETPQAGGPSAGFEGDLAGFLDQALLLDQAPEVRLVQAQPRQALDRLLELEESKGWRHQLEDERAVLDLAAQAP